jgi:hypothetical protein
VSHLGSTPFLLKLQSLRLRPVGDKGSFSVLIDNQPILFQSKKCIADRLPAHIEMKRNPLLD